MTGTGAPEGPDGDTHAGGSEPGAAPVARLLVDAMNVIGSRPDGWWRDLDGAVRRLVRDIGDADLETPVVIVCDGDPVDELDPGPGIAVEFAGGPGPDAADQHILELAGSAPDPEAVAVVTSDRALARQLQAMGVPVRGAGGFLREIGG